jgi:hypothetical protein
MKNRVSEDAEGFWYARKDYELGFHAVRSHKRTPDERSHLALKLLLEMVKVPFETDGEDTAGRQRGRRLIPSELVEIAFGVADAAFAKMETEGRFIPVPTPEDCEAAYQDFN